MSVEVARALDVLRQAEWTLRGVDAALRAAKRKPPPSVACDAVTSALFSVAETVQEATWLEPGREAELDDAFQRHVGVWLYRSRLFARSRHRPRGALQDAQLLEWIYDLESAPGRNPEQPGMVSCLDHAFAQMQSTRALWHQRRRLAQIVEDELRHLPTVRVLHVGGGGARYLRDLVQRGEGERIHLTCVDEDVVTLRLLERRFGGAKLAGLTTLRGSVRELADLRPGGYDVVLAPCGLEILADPAARELLGVLVRRLDSGGLLALSSAHPGDRSAFLRRLVAGWSPISRSERGLLALAPKHARMHTERSSEGALAYLIGRGPE